MNSSYPIVAKEGWFYLSLSAVIAIGVTHFAGWLWALPLWLLTLFILQFFRDPPRTAPGNEKTVVSPADGRVLVVEKTQDTYLNRPAIKISVFMNVFNVHSNRSPVDGKVEKIWYHPGNFINAALDKASLDNERNALVIKTQTGQNVVCVQIAGLIARRILCYVKENTSLHRGDRFGFIRFGSRVDIYLPVDAKVKTVLGDKVYGGSTILAELA